MFKQLILMGLIKLRGARIRSEALDKGLCGIVKG